MVRDFVKSAVSFSWALSLLGIKQAVNLGKPGQQNAANIFTPMTQAAVSQLDDSTRGIFRSGDNLQSRAVDMAFASFNPVNWINPSNWVRFVGGQPPSASGTPPAAQTANRPSSGQPGAAGGVADTALFWMNPLNWVNPNTWSGGGRSKGSCGCGQAACSCGQAVAGVTQAVNQVVGQAAAAFSGQPPATRGGAANPPGAANTGANWGPPKSP